MPMQSRGSDRVESSSDGRATQEDLPTRGVNMHGRQAEEPRPVVLFLDRLFPAIGGMETHGLALRDHLIKMAGSRSVLIWERQPASGLNDGEAHVLRGDRLDVVLRETARFEQPVVFLNSCHWIEQLDPIRGAAPNGTIVQRTGGNEILKARHSDPTLRLEQRQRFWADALNRNVDLVLSNSRFSTERLQQLGIDPTRISRVSGGFDARRCATAARFRMNNRRRVFGPQPTSLCVSTCSRLVPFKGLETVIEAVAVAQRSREILLVVVGEGPLRQELEALARESLRPGSYRFLGALPPHECLSVIAASDVYVGLPLELARRKRHGWFVHTETMGRSFYEAVACGTPVVGTQVGGLPELIDDWNGTLIAPGDSGAAAQGLVRHALRGRLNPDRVRRFRTRFSWRAVFLHYRREFGL
jgi:glycosyltransferase involved in cell wall biosynthesis